MVAPLAPDRWLPADISSGAYEARGTAALRKCRHVIFKIGRSPRTCMRLLVDRCGVPIWLRCLGVQVGAGCSFVGRPVVTLVSGARITLGDHVKMFSRFDSNPAGLPHPTILAALSADSVIAIGERSGLSGASIVARVGITIGRDVLVGAGACIWDTDFHPLDPWRRHENQTRDARCAPIWIGDDVFIGARAIILKGVRIGSAAVIGAGAVVARDIEPGQIVAGNPARPIGAVHRKPEV